MPNERTGDTGAAGARMMTNPTEAYLIGVVMGIIWGFILGFIVAGWGWVRR